MDELKAFINQNTLMVAAVLGALTLVAAFLRFGLVAVILGMLCGTALMWYARPVHAESADPDEP
jgi:hypothetical protein